jgi:hypothetical protein
MPFFNDRRNSYAPRDIAMPWDSDPDNGLDPRNNPLSPKFTGTKAPIPGKPGQFTVLNKGEKPFKPDTRTAGQKRNAELDESIAYVDKSIRTEPTNRYKKDNMNNGWMARGQHALKQKTATYDRLMNKVGETSPRYNQLLAAKERTVAGMNRSVGNSAGMSRVSGGPVSPQGYTPPRNGKPAMFGPNYIKPTKTTNTRIGVAAKGSGINVNNRAFYDNESRDNRARQFLTSPENKAYYANKKKK